MLIPLAQELWAGGKQEENVKMELGGRRRTEVKNEG
jgi:hypothetical protein